MIFIKNLSTVCLILPGTVRLNGSAGRIGKALEMRSLPVAEPPLGSCETELAWGFQSKGEVVLLVCLGKGSKGREHKAPVSRDPWFLLSVSLQKPFLLTHRYP